MFNSSLKEDALEVHKNAVDRYNQSCNDMRTACSNLHDTRERSIDEIIAIEILINSIANKPKEIDKQLGEVKQHILKFRQTKEYSEAAYKEALKSGVNIVSGVAAGSAVATAAPSVAMSIATTFGRASTGTLIRTLSGAPAQKAALAWIGRMTGGIATKGVITGAGMASGQAFLALAGPLGWGISGASTALSLMSLSSNNKKISTDAINEAKQIMAARETLRETTEKICYLENKTSLLLKELTSQANRAAAYKNMNYGSLSTESRLFLGTLVKNTWSLASLLNQTVE